MSNVARLHRDPVSERRDAPPAKPPHRLGPAEVLVGGPSTVTLRLSDGEEREARVALAFAYEPAQGDTVLAIADDAGCYVIGVLAGAGKGVLTFPGDLSVRAQGRLHLSGEEGVEIDAPHVQIRTGSLGMLARAVTQRFESLRQVVVDLLSVQAGKSHTTIDGPSYTRAESATLLTKDKVTINGKAIHLG